MKDIRVDKDNKDNLGMEIHAAEKLTKDSLFDEPC